MGEVAIFEQMKEISLTPEAVTDFIYSVESKLVATPSEVQITPQVNHYLADGIYGREIELKAGTVLTGHKHKYSTINFLSEGELSVLSIQGYGRIKAPAIFVSPKGVKRLGFAHTDCKFTCITKAISNDPDEIYNDVIDVDEGKK